VFRDEQLSGVQFVSLEPGQFVFGRKVASEELDIHESAIYRIMQFLTKAGNITIKSNNKFSIISINNWHTYQQDEIEIEQQANNKRTTSEHKQEVKKEKNNTYSEEFLNFYEEYPRRVDKSGAWKAWEKCNGNRPEIDLLLEILSRHKKTDQWTRDDGKYIPYPATWINKRRWEDEVEVEPSGPFG
jgi:hypothetical protein